MIGITKAGVCAILWDSTYERTLAINWKGFTRSLSEYSFTICLMPYNRKYNVLSALLNKTFLPI